MRVASRNLFPALPDFRRPPFRSAGGQFNPSPGFANATGLLDGYVLGAHAQPHAQQVRFRTAQDHLGVGSGLGLGIVLHLRDLGIRIVRVLPIIVIALVFVVFVVFVDLGQFCKRQCVDPQIQRRLREKCIAALDRVAAQCF